MRSLHNHVVVSDSVVDVIVLKALVFLTIKFGVQAPFISLINLMSLITT